MVRSIRSMSAVAAALVLLGLSAAFYSQDKPKESVLDGEIKAAFEYLKKSDYPAARKHFESAWTIYTKDPTSSDWLFSQLTIPDEGPGDDTSTDPMIGQIMRYRHSMGTKQALLMFLSFTCQLQGDKAQAEKYFQQVYGLQSVVWGLSWRTYIPPIEGVFHTAIKAEKSEVYGRYLYLAGVLMDDAGEEVAGKFFEQAQVLVPNDAEIAANLASYYVVRLRAADAQKLARISLSINAKNAHVLIDLASAEWLLGDLENAAKHAKQASEIDPSLPGPHSTLTLIYIAQNKNDEALKEAEQGVRLSDRHFFYLAVEAIALEALGRSDLAVKNIREAWPSDYPSEDNLKKWFLKDKPLELLLRAMKRAKG